MQLYEIQNKGNRYCGPAVISALAGITTVEAAALIRQHSQGERRAIKGTSTQEVRRALDALGFRMSGMTYSASVEASRRSVNLARWAKDCAHSDDVYLISAGNHWQLVQGRYAICGKTKNFVLVADHPNARTFVKEAWRVTRARTVEPAAVIPKKDTATPNARRKARALAAKHGVLLEPITDEPDSSIGVFQASGHRDPYDDGHYFSPNDWAGILDRVQEYVACQSESKPVPALTVKQEAHALAALHGITIEQDDHGNRTIWVYPPEPDADNDPHADSHYVDTWGAAMARVQQYAAILANVA